MSSKTSGKQIQLESLSIQCETCSKPIGKKEAIFRCVCCATIMHMSPSCTKISNEIINAPQQVNQNVLLLCNACLQQKKRDGHSGHHKSPPQKQNNLEIKDDIQTTIKDDIQHLKKPHLTPIVIVTLTNFLDSGLNGSIAFSIKISQE